MRLKIVLLITVIILLLNIIIPSIDALATDTDNLSVIKGTYQYTSNENSNKQLEDSFEYRDDCFMRSSFLGCEHLEALSSQVAISSASWYGEEEDKYEIDYSNNSHNVVDFLTKMDFKDVSTNKYYTLEKEENSSAVAVGHKTITTSEKTYTLLAVIPRSASYKQEWVGNFNVGNNGIHEGFKAARDEILRYVKKYIQDNNIEGNLKVWTVGHSRGAAVSNMLGAFFAGGGIEYFGNNVNITPEDVYCYTYATPRTIIAGTDKNIELSVEGYRGGESYSNDTIGDAFSYTKAGKVNPQDKVYGGIRNFISYYDFLTMLPLEVWDYTRYGTDITIDHDGKVSESAMLKELKEVSPYAYNKYVNKSGPNLFEGKTFDIKTLKLVKDNNINLLGFVKDRIDGLAYKLNSIDKYISENFQDGLQAAAGIYGMSLVYLNDLDINDAIDNKEEIIYSALYTYLAYASERLQEEGRAQNESDAFKIAVEELFTFLINKEVNDNTTVDELIENLLTCACESENEILLDKLVSLITEIIPENYQKGITGAVAQYHKDYDSGKTISSEEVWKAFFKACVYGTDEEAPAYLIYPTAKDARNMLYQMVCFALIALLPNEGYNLATVAFMDDEGQIAGTGKISNLLDIIYPMLMDVKDKDGNIIKKYQNFSEVADYRLNTLIDKISNNIITDCKEKYGEKFQTDLRKHIEHAKENISSIREAFTYFFLYDEDGFNTEKIIGNISTFISNPDAIALPHYNEIYIAYAKAAQAVNCGYEDHITQNKADETADAPIKIEQEIETEKQKETEKEIETEEQNSKEYIKTNASTPASPKTGDNIIMIISIFVISTLGAYTTLKINKNQKKRKH